MIELERVPKNFILTTPESLRKKILDRVVEYEELYDVDLSKTHFFTYIIDILSMLTSDVVNALTLSKQESYLVTANFPSSIFNWAAYLGYVRNFATAAEVDVLLGIPLNFNESVSFRINYFTAFKAEEIVYTNPYEYYLFQYDKTKHLLTGKAISTDSSRDLKIVVNNNIAYTVIHVYQIEKIEEEKIIPYDLQPYQPYSFVIPFKDYVSNLEVYIKEPDAIYEEKWEKAENYFEMGPKTKKFFYKYETSNSIRIIFGNDVFGKQPKPGSKVRVVLFTTKADNGSVIANAINQMDRIFYIDSTGTRKEIAISVSNVVASTMGSKGDTLNDVKNKAIARFRSRERLVTEKDYEDLKYIVDNKNLYAFSKAILKRSDIKVNEICLYLVLAKEYKKYKLEVININESNVIPERTLVVPIPTNSIIAKTNDDKFFIPPFTTFVDLKDNIEYICPFAINRESTTFAYMVYIINKIQEVPNAMIYNQIDYPLSFIKWTAESFNNFQNVRMILKYSNLNNIVDMTKITAKLVINFRTSIKGPYECSIDIANSEIKYEYEMSEVETGPIHLEYHIFYENNKIGVVKITTLFKKDLRDTMFLSTKEIKENGNIKYMLYDLPCILKSYYTNMTEREKMDFEKNVIQNLIQYSSLTNYRMMNTSINLKFAKTIGYITNVNYNPINKGEVFDILDTPPNNPNIGDKYIVAPMPKPGVWSDKANKIAIYTSFGWFYVDAIPGDIVKVVSKNKRYTFSGNANRWIETQFKIPYEIEVYLYIDKLEGNESELIRKVKQHLMANLCDYFGLDKDQYRSVMYKAIQELKSGIKHCEIKIPEVDIEFKFNKNEFTKTELMEYVPEYVYTTEENIKVNIIL